MSMGTDSDTRLDCGGRVEPWLAEFHRRAATDIPVMHQVGRYLFFAACAFGFSLTAGFICRIADAPKIITQYAGTAAFLVAFLALRDMSKLWDLARKASAPLPLDPSLSNKEDKTDD